MRSTYLFVLLIVFASLLLARAAGAETTDAAFSDPPARDADSAKSSSWRPPVLLPGDASPARPKDLHATPVLDGGSSSRLRHRAGAVTLALSTVVTTLAVGSLAFEQLSDGHGFGSFWQSGRYDKPVIWPTVVTAVVGAVGMVTGVALLGGKEAGRFAFVPGLPSTAVDVALLASVAPRPTPFGLRGMSLRLRF